MFAIIQNIVNRKKNKKLLFHDKRYIINLKRYIIKTNASWLWQKPCRYDTNNCLSLTARVANNTGHPNLKIK